MTRTCSTWVEITRHGVAHLLLLFTTEYEYSVVRFLTPLLIKLRAFYNLGLKLPAASQRIATYCTDLRGYCQ